MNPYLSAHAAYISAERELSWSEALEIHLQHGAVISTPEAFVMARPVYASWPEENHLDPFLIAPPTLGAWHVWAAAGDVHELLRIARLYNVRSITFQRHGQQRLRRMSIANP